MTHCFDLDGISRFTDKAYAYVQARPGYPNAALEFISSSLTDKQAAAVIDLGAGTGIGSILLAQNFTPVVAMEPNIEMLRAGGAAEGVLPLCGRAEQLPFKSGSASLLTVFNAFHWFQPDLFFTEAHRVLKTQGRLALIWNDWDLNDAFTREFVKIMRSAAGSHPDEDREAEVAPLYRTKLFRNVCRGSFENLHMLDLERLLLRMKSVSYIPKEGKPWEELEARLTTLYQKSKNAEGLVAHRYHTSVFLAERSSGRPASAV